MSYPPPPCPANNKVLKKYGPNGHVRWTRRSSATERRWSSPSGITPGTLTVHCHEYGARGAATDRPTIVRRYSAGGIRWTPGGGGGAHPRTSAPSAAFPAAPAPSPSHASGHVPQRLLVLRIGILGVDGVRGGRRGGWRLRIVCPGGGLRHVIGFGLGHAGTGAGLLRPRGSHHAEHQRPVYKKQAMGGPPQAPAGAARAGSAATTRPALPGGTHVSLQQVCRGFSSRESPTQNNNPPPPPLRHIAHLWFLYGALDSPLFILHRMMQCRSSHEGPPSRCLDPTISVFPWQQVVVVKTLRIHPVLTFAQPPNRAAGPRWRSQSPPPVCPCEIWHSPPGSAQPYQEDPGRLAQLITAVPPPPPLGAFSHSAGTAPIITVIIQVTILKTTHLRNHAQSIQNSKIQTSDACHGSQGPKVCPL